MFEKFISDGFIYQPVTTDLISLKTDRKIILYPYAKYEDIGIQYFLTYKENNYRIKFYCADTAIVSETNGIAEYLQKRMGRKSDKIIGNYSVPQKFHNVESEKNEQKNCEFTSIHKNPNVVY